MTELAYRIDERPRRAWESLLARVALTNPIVLGVVLAISLNALLNGVR